MFLFLVEKFISEDHLKNDEKLVAYIRDNDGWLSVAFIASCSEFADCTYQTILYALQDVRSELIECSALQPLCIRLRRQPLRAIHSQRSDPPVLVTGLPHDAKYEELLEFFHRRFPVDELTMLPSPQRFNGKVHLLFHDPQHSQLFVERSHIHTVIFERNLSSGLKTSYRLTCQMSDPDHHETTREVLNSPRPHRFVAGKYDTWR